ncbi:hypothetical protein DICPUDRAFT_39626 [Dictyostelium purpureum]|uniref:LUD domain-containing protein n=1 Tax=Dictyostelium purpureum TaxID=5786 RepID=F0ZWM7_DICPU|nr:uncharacterized protein DICPUDRAFT_39626 [Dictyostelium purpureum]EGC31657.1 hypothetical protein DICPUDRAFT_39626 [Dictyostelium purpureum]|eukprot:XP_003291823.1 hypothetical protein DICPUDRAFT_39626 [Dictyostelium purpureum]
MYKFKELFELEPDFKPTNLDKYRSFPSDEQLEEAIKNLQSKNHDVIVVEDEEQAMEVIKKSIPSQSTVMSAGSVTLEEIGFKNYYFGDQHTWKNLHADILKETDITKQITLRKQALSCDYFLSSVGAISKQGDLFVADASGTRVGGFTSAGNVIVVAGVNKIVGSEEEGVERATGFCYQCESVRARAAYKTAGSVVQNFVQVRFGNVFGKRNTTIILIKKLLGY